MKFSEKIIKLRKEHGLSQEEFGNELNLSRQAISKWESEQSQPDLDNVREISKKFNVSIEYLVNDELDIDSKKESLKQINKQKKTKVLKIFLIIIIIYVLIIIIKYIRFTQIYYKAKNMNENKNYDLSIENYYKDSITGENFRALENYYNYNGISLQVHYDGDYYNNPVSMNYIDWNKRKKYFFNYIESDQNPRYEYEEILLEENSPDEFNIKEITLNYAPTNFWKRILFAIDPRKEVSLFGSTIKFKYNNGYTEFVFDEDTGQIKEVTTVTDKISTYIYVFYEWNESLINESDVENPLTNPEIECIKIENFEN